MIAEHPANKLKKWFTYALIALILSGVEALVLLYLQRRVRSTEELPERVAPPQPITHLTLTGLTEAEAVARQIPINEEPLTKAEERRFWRALVRQHLLTFFNLDMIGAAIAMYLLGSAWSAFLSLLVLLFSFGLNVFQELYTKRQLDGMIAKLQPQVTVIRESRVRSVSLKMIVPGDMVVVGLGDRILVQGEVVSDGRIVVDEATDSGGLVRRLKRAGDAVYTGSICAEGQAVYCVTDAEQLKTVLTQELKTSLLPDKLTPLQQLIEGIFKILFVLVLIFNALLFLDMGAAWLGLAIFDGTLARDIVSQIFAIAPTSLFLIIAVSYAVGLLRIADVGALVYRSETVESLANTSVICFSGSGTLTGQQATLEILPAPTGYDQLSNSRIYHLLGTCLHSVASSQPIRLALAQTFPGEPRTVTELAPFFSAFGWSGITFDHDDLRGTYILGHSDRLQPHLVVSDADEAQDTPVKAAAVDEAALAGRRGWLKRFWPFGQTQEASPNALPEANETTAHLKSENQAPDTSADESPHTASSPADPERPSGFRARWGQRFSRWFASESVTPPLETKSKPGDGVELVFAFHPEVLPLQNATGFPELPSDLVPLGRVHLIERVRPEAAAVVGAFAKAGVSIKILSAGDAQQLAETVKQLKLSTEELPTVISGTDLPQPGTAAFARTVQTHHYFARLTPGQQAAVVAELRSQREYVAMAGNRVSDIPAMQQANVRITSQSGTQAALTLADIVLLDPSLIVLPNVLYRGQQIVNGLLDTFKLYLTHVASHLLMLVTVIFMLGVPGPYSSTQASIISFFAITIPAILLPFWASLGRITRRSMVHQLVHFVLPAALTTALLAVALYVWFLRTTSNLEYARVAVTHALVAAGFVRVIFVKPPTRAWVGGNSLSGDWRPVWMTLGAAAVYALFVAITAAVPTFQGWFDLDALPRPQDYLIITAAVAVWALITRFLWRLLRRYSA
jgi:magnesium-transporting ATPase (P-type)